MQHLLVEQAPSSASSSQSSLGSWYLHRRAGLERTDPLPPPRLHQSGVLSWWNFCKVPLPDLSAFIVGVTQSDCS